MTELPQQFNLKPENLRWLAALAVGEDIAPDESSFKGLTYEPQETQVNLGDMTTDNAADAEDAENADDTKDSKEDTTAVVGDEVALDAANSKSSTVYEKAQEACSVFLKL